MSARYLLAVLPLLISLVGCDGYEPVDFEEQIVVEGYLEAGEELAAIRVSRTAPLNSSYDFEKLAVSGAEVKIHLLKTDGTIERTYRFAESGNRSGIYIPLTDDTVRPMRTYRLEVSVEGQRAPITSRTTVPALLELLRVSTDTLTYQGPEQLEIEIAPDASTRQRVFAFTARALDVRRENLTPLAAAVLKESDLELEDLSTGSSPLLNEANYEVSENGMIRIRLPWIAIAFYGPNRLSISAVDENYYDFRRTADIQQGGSTLAPGEIPNVLEHIQGGTGVFGSYASVVTEIYIERPDEEKP